MPTPAKVGSAVPRPLSELSPTEKRRNSPSWNQTTKKMALTDSSPFQSSPLENTTSPRMFWQNRSFNSENNYGAVSGSPSPCRRSSIERLQRASRVKNSNILALEQKQEYDPTRVPHVERPLAKVQGNAFGGNGAAGLRSENHNPFSHQRSESKTSIPALSPSKSAFPPMSPPMRPTTPSKDQPSPMKSSLSSTRFKSSFDMETGTWSEMSGDERDLPEGKSLHRHQKSVTFDAAPPQVNEYEMATPDLSSIGSNSREGSYDSGEDDDDEDHYFIDGSVDQDDSFDASLEDTDKTPVVGPDDWRQGSHDHAFEKSPGPDDFSPVQKPPHRRTDSSNSNGESRPLPPLPGMGQASSRSLPSPPPASDAKADSQNIGNGRMPLEERLRLMMLSDDGKSAAEQQRERRMRRAGPRERAESHTPERESRSPSVQPHADHADYEEEDTIGELSGLEEYQLPPRISRESILRRVNGNKPFERESDYQFSSPPAPSALESGFQYDPDVAIPSTEDSMMDDDDDDESDEGSVIITRDVEDQDFDVDSLTDLYQRSETFEGDDLDDDDDKMLSGDDSASQYSDETESQEGNKVQEPEEDQVPTPRATSPADEPAAPAQQEPEARASFELPDRAEQTDFSKSFDSCMLAKPEEPEVAAEPEKSAMTDAQSRPFTPEQQLTRSLTKPEYDGSGWGEPEETYDDPGTPDSVIHHPLPDSELEAARVSPAIPEQIATIKSASGSKLKTRPSATPSDLAAMREARRQVSREIPPIPERHRNRISRDMEVEVSEVTGDFLERHPSFKKRSLTLDLDLGLSLDQDFDRVIEAQKVAFHQVSYYFPHSTTAASLFQAEQEPAQQELLPHTATTGNLDTNIAHRKQRGYLMRQNTKVVTASDKEGDDARACRSAGNSPVKAARPQSWTVEPWSGGQRKRSIRKRLPVTGPTPPLPGQESNATALGQVHEEEMAVEMATEESGERGRLFVKVMGVKDLDLPIPKNERTWFSLTLDNGVHCVTTAWLELARNAPIGQEFELVVPNDLEFQLTLNVKLEKPAPTPISKKALPSPTKTSKPKTSTFSRVFASPKKRREMELRQKQQEEEERLAAQRDAQARQMMLKSAQQPTAWDLLSPIAAEDGSFARAYVCLKEHEARCFGRPYLVDVATFNEWATEEAGFASSVKSKRGPAAAAAAAATGNAIRRAPYKIGKLELQLLFVPRPKGATDDDMPKSMNSCIREMKAAEERLARCWEGHLSQQGGDCPYWRRRYFKLVGAKLTAYHEATRQPRATINLANAKRLIDDRRTLMEKETTGRGGRRRRSAFAEEEEGYMFVEEGFRIRFNNGELIDFYADCTADKEGWMAVLGEVVGRDSLGSLDGAGGASGDDLLTGNGGSRMKGKWCELALKREEAVKKRAEGRRVHSRTKSMYV
ncbi:cell division protein anillin-domain-containing protein [Chaetomidium leptoderma]|uniref:Cell division protein anillin-domain-containing protein n=1 Tax=Chaetomidium leptoderma TaxID=669021 RepID=A0AAN7A2I0_9PEZI|nr:cell division protein anillin-domain-containing protein [Chaetomidium leptoderma]